MISRALNAKPKKSFKSTYEWSKSVSVNEDHEDSSSIIGFMEDLPLILCGQTHDHLYGKNRMTCGSNSYDQYQRTVQLSLKDVLRASVGVLGESQLGMTEKVVVSDGRIFVLKRFRKLSIRKSDFAKRIDKFSQVVMSDKCTNIVPITAYLYAKRIKFVLSDYYPMGSLADLLAGSRQHDHTRIDWEQRMAIVCQIAQAIAFIHAISPAKEKSIQMNVHGNVKSSNVLINTDFSACLSDYGITQLADRVDSSNARDSKLVAPPYGNFYLDKLCQKSDVYNFGVIMLDLLGGPQGTSLFMKTDLMDEIKGSIKSNSIAFFEFNLSHGKQRKQALKVLDIALACINRLPEARPTIEQILLDLIDVCNIIV